MDELKQFPSVQDLLNFFEAKKSPLKLVTKNIIPGNCQIKKNQTNRPGLNLFGFFKFFAYERIQIFGKGEYEYLKVLSKNQELDSVKAFFDYKISTVVFSHNNKPPQPFLDMANQNKVPVLISSQDTSTLIDWIYEFFSEYLFVKQVVHGLMMEIFGYGVLMKGSAQTPRSECALELIERGHRFVADDVVNVKLLKDKKLLAYTSNLISHHMEIKGIGIINVAHLFGVKSILMRKQIDLVIELEAYDKAKDYDFIGDSEQSETILGIKIPKITIPFSHAGILPILIETATMNYRLKMTGYDTASEFKKKLKEHSLMKKNARKKN